MNNNDLSTLLREQATTVTDHLGVSRADVVRRRARRTQQRRTTAVVLATVVGVLGTIGVATLPGDREVSPAAAPADVLGRQVPRTVTTLDGSYRFVRTFEGVGRVNFELPKLNRDYVLRAATQGAEGRIKLGATQLGQTPDAESDVNLPAGGFGYSVTTRADQQSQREWRAVSSAGQPVAVAIYELSKPPAGYTQGEVTFPETLAGAGLVNAVLGDKGQREVGISVPGKSRTLQVVTYCSGVEDPEAYGVAVSFDRRQDKVIGSCDDDAAPTVVRSNQVAAMIDTATHEARARAVDGAGRDVALPAGARIGFAVYESAPTSVGDLRETVEYGGHLWRLEDSVARAVGQSGGGETVSLPLDSRSGPVVVAWATRDSGTRKPTGTMRLLVDGQEASRATSGGEALSLVSNGKKSSVEIQVGQGSPATDAVLGTYKLVR